MSIADKITRLKTARDNIRTALANYNVDASDHGYEDFADDIEGITIFDPDDYAVNVVEVPTGDPIEPDPSEIRTFSNIQTDGTTSGVVNTNIYLFSSDFRFGFEIEADFDNMTDSGTGDYRRIFSCESNTSPYPGLNLTRKKGDNDTATLILNNTNTVEIEFQLLSEHNTVSVKYDAKSGDVVLVANGTTVRDTITPLPVFATYFTLGGQMWVGGTKIATDRCAAIKINSITIKPIKYQMGGYGREYTYIGKSVSQLGSGIYAGNNDVIEVQLPTSITQLKGSFNECANLRSINLQNITRLEQDSLRGCKSIRILYMPNLTYLHHYAFSPGAETTFALEEIHFPKMAELGDYNFRSYSFFTKCPNLRLIDVSGATTIGNSTFQNFKVGTGEINVILSENLTTLGQYIFINSNYRMNVNGGTVYLPNLESARRDCFSQTLIEKITSLGKITEVPSNAFGGCKNLSFIRIPATVTSMQISAFANNYMNRVLIMEPVTPPSINGTFNSTYDIYVPDDSVEDYKAASNWSSAASKIHPMSEYTGTD